jgi:hypothetical protein
MTTNEKSFLYEKKEVKTNRKTSLCANGNNNQHLLFYFSTLLTGKCTVRNFGFGF